MKIRFEFEIADLSKAGEIQKYLKDMNVSFDMSESKPKLAKGRRNKNFPIMTVKKAEQIIRISKDHKNWTYGSIADAAQAGHEVTRKILNGSHPIFKRKLKAVKNDS